MDWYYGDMERISEEGFFKRLEEEGYDAYDQDGESESIAVFTKAPVVDAFTGKQL